MYIDFKFSQTIGTFVKLPNTRPLILPTIGDESSIYFAENVETAMRELLRIAALQTILVRW